MKKLKKPLAFLRPKKKNTIESSRLFMRPIDIDEDAAFFLELMNSEPYKKNIADRNITTLEQTKALLKERYVDGGKLVFVIFNKQHNQPVGSCGLYSRNGLEFMDLGYAIHPSFFRYGYAYEASQLLINFARKKLKQKSLDAITSVYNTASQNLLIKLNFVEQGLIKIPEYDEELLHFQLDL